MTKTKQAANTATPRVGHGPGGWSWLTESYIEAAVSLIERGPHRKGGRFQGWPAFYLMRHALELSLKSCLNLADAYLGPSTHDGLTKRHDLKHLVGAVGRRIAGIVSKQLRDFIHEVHKLDPNGEDFKYTATGDFDVRASSMKFTGMIRAWELCEEFLTLAAEVHELPIRADHVVYPLDSNPL